MTDKRVGVRIDVGVGGKDQVHGLDASLDALGKSAAGAGAAATAGATGTRQLGTAAEQAGHEVAATGKAVAALGSAAAQADPKLDAAKRSVQNLGTEAGGAQRHVAALRDQLIAGFAVGQLVQAAAQMEQVAAGLQAVSGDGQLAGEQMDFVRRMAQSAGVDVVAAGQAFLGLAAATKGTAVEGEPARQVFEAVTLAMAKAGKSSAETQNALLALSQIASKGTVSMEELRGQLGEALPGALQAAANGLGITTQDLIALVESGQLAAEDLFPALAKGLKDLYGGAPAAQTLSQEITNIKNAFVEMAANIGDEGGLATLKVLAEAAQTAIAFLGDTLIQTGQYIGTVAAAVTSLDFSGLSKAFADIEADSRTRLLKAAENNAVLTAALKAGSDEAIKAALAAREAAAATEQAGESAGRAAGGVAKLGVEYGKARAELEGQLALVSKEVEAVKARGEAAVAQAAALNDEAGKRRAVGQAAADEAEALGKLAKLRAEEATLLQQERDAKAAALALAGPISAQRKKELDDLDAAIAKKKVDADTTRAQAAAAELKAKATSREVQAAQELEETAQVLAVTRKASAQVAVTELQVQRELAKQAEELAILMGDEEAVRRFKIQQLEIEIKLVKAKAEVAKVEAEGIIAVSKAKLAELQLSGQLTPLKKAEIEAAITLAEAKLKEAKAIGGSTALIQEQIRFMREATIVLDGSAKAAGGAAKSQGDLAAGMQTTNNVLVEQIRLLQGATPEQQRYASALDATYRAQLQLDKYGPGAQNPNGTGGIAGFGAATPTPTPSPSAPSSSTPSIGGTFANAVVPTSGNTSGSIATPTGADGRFQSGSGSGPVFVNTRQRREAGLLSGGTPRDASGGAALTESRVQTPAAAGNRATTGAQASTTRVLKLELGGGRSLDYQAGSAAEAARVESLLRTLAVESQRAS